MTHEQTGQDVSGLCVSSERTNIRRESMRNRPGTLLLHCARVEGPIARFTMELSIRSTGEIAMCAGIRLYSKTLQEYLVRSKRKRAHASFCAVFFVVLKPARQNIDPSHLILFLDGQA